MTAITPTFDISITYDRHCKDYNVLVDNEYIGSRPTYHDGEELAREHIHDLLASGITATATQLDGGTDPDEIAADMASDAPLTLPQAVAADMAEHGPICNVEEDHIAYLEEQVLNEVEDYIAERNDHALDPKRCESCDSQGLSLPDWGEFIEERGGYTYIRARAPHFSGIYRRPPDDLYHPWKHVLSCSSCGDMSCTTDDASLCPACREGGEAVIDMDTPLTDAQLVIVEREYERGCAELAALAAAPGKADVNWSSAPARCLPAVTSCSYCGQPEYFVRPDGRRVYHAECEIPIDDESYPATPLTLPQAVALACGEPAPEPQGPEEQTNYGGWRRPTWIGD